MKLIVCQYQLHNCNIISLTKAISYMITHCHGSDCGFKEQRTVCHWVILPIPMYGIAIIYT